MEGLSFEPWSTNVHTDMFDKVAPADMVSISEGGKNDVNDWVRAGMRRWYLIIAVARSHWS